MSTTIDGEGVHSNVIGIVELVDMAMLIGARNRIQQLLDDADLDAATHTRLERAQHALEMQDHHDGRGHFVNNLLGLED